MAVTRALLIAALFAVPVAAAECAGSQCEADEVSLLQSSGLGSDNEYPADRDEDDWDVMSIMKDFPEGEYMKHMVPVMEAIGLSHVAHEDKDEEASSMYKADGTHKDRKETMREHVRQKAEEWKAVGGVTNERELHEVGSHEALHNQYVTVLNSKHKFGQTSWNRMKQYEAKPSSMGMHAYVFAAEKSSKMLVAFRPGCTDTKSRRCQADMCVLKQYESFGKLSKGVYGDDAKNDCNRFKPGELDYVEQAAEFVNLLQREHPFRKICLTGHGLGGMLAAVTAAQDHRFSAVAVGPTPFYNVLSEQLGYTDDRIKALAKGKRIVSVCDSYDCAIPTGEVPNARMGSVTCMYNNEENSEPSECNEIRALLSKEGLPKLFSKVQKAMECKHSVEAFDRYWSLITKSTFSNRMAPRSLPTCKESYSTATDELFKHVAGNPLRA